MKSYAAPLFAGLMLCMSAAAQSTTEELDQLVQWMSGSFTSAAQAQADSDYYAISLDMVPLWQDDEPGAWLYVEQSLSSTPDKPYRQRVYYVSQIEENLFSSDIYELTSPERLVGAASNPQLLDSLTRDDLKYKEGCSVFLTYDGFQYSGATNEQSCQSALRGAAYATSEVTLLPGELRSWDRGFDAQGKQVWGAEKGPYIFVKSESAGQH